MWHKLSTKTENADAFRITVTKVWLYIHFMQNEMTQWGLQHDPWPTWKSFFAFCTRKGAHSESKIAVVNFLNKGGGHRALEGGQFHFWSNLKVPFLYTCGIDQSFWIFYPTFDEWKSRFGVQSSQKRDLKNKKNEKKVQKQPILGMFWFSSN